MRTWEREVPRWEDMEHEDVGLEGPRGRWERIHVAPRGFPGGGRCLGNTVPELSLVGAAGEAVGAGASVMRQVPRAGKWMVQWIQGHPRLSATSCVTLGK